MQVQAAFSLFGDGIAAVDVAAEFEKLDQDASGSIEIVEFGALLRRLAALARGAPPLADGRGLLRAVTLEAQLLSSLDWDSLWAVPLSYHAFARRLVSGMQLLGFALDQIEVVLRALFHPDPEECDEAIRLSWLLLAGTDWALARNLTQAELDDVSKECAKRAHEKRQRERERRRKEENLKREQTPDAEPPSRRRSGWSRLRERRVGGRATAALAAAVFDADERRRQQPEMLSYGFVPRKDGFDDISTITLSEFERIVAVFGDYLTDRELEGCREELTDLFNALDGPKSGEEAGSFNSSSFKSIQTSDFSQDSDVFGIDGAVFYDFIRTIRSLVPRYGGGDALASGAGRSRLSQTLTKHRAGDAVPSTPAWMSSVTQRNGRRGGAALLDEIWRYVPTMLTGRVDVLSILDESTKALIPLAHLSTVSAVVTNLIAAELTSRESNLLLRALYSFNDAHDGEGYRDLACSWLGHNRSRLREGAKQILSGKTALRTEVTARLEEINGLEPEQDEASAPLPEIAREDGIHVDELQIVVCLLGEHLTPRQLIFVFTLIVSSEIGIVSYDEVERTLFLLFRKDNESSTIQDDESRARELLDAELWAEAGLACVGRDVQRSANANVPASSAVNDDILRSVGRAMTVVGDAFGQLFSK